MTNLISPPLIIPSLEYVIINLYFFFRKIRGRNSIRFWVPIAPSPRIRAGFPRRCVVYVGGGLGERRGERLAGHLPRAAQPAARRAVVQRGDEAHTVPPRDQGAVGQIQRARH